MTELKVNFRCVKHDVCHRNGLCIGDEPDGFICPFLRIYSPTKRAFTFSGIRKCDNCGREVDGALFLLHGKFVCYQCFHDYDIRRVVD